MLLSPGGVKAIPFLQSSSVVGAQVADAPPLYPSLSKLHFEKDRHGLLTEQNLLEFYHNPLYMMSEEFIDRFVQVIFRTGGT